MASSLSPDKKPSLSASRGRGGPRKDLMERALLDCAAELFAAKGFSATNMQDIADAAGVGRTTLYHYFRSKDEFLTAFVEDVTIAASIQLRDLPADPGLGPRAQLQKIAETLVLRQLERSLRFRVLDREENNLPPLLRKRHQTAKREVLKKIAGIVKAGIGSGEFIATDANIAALSVIGMCNWTVWWFKPDAKKSAQEVATIVSELAVNALRASNPAADVPSSHALISEIRCALDSLEQEITR